MEKKSVKEQVFTDSFWNISTTILARFGGLIFTVILARFLNPTGFGLYGLSLSIAMMFLTFADLGVNQTMLRFVSVSIAKNASKAAAYFRYILRIKMILSLVISILLLVLSYPLANVIFRKPELFSLLLILSLYSFILALEGFFETIFYIRNKVKYTTIKEIISQFSKIILVLLVFLLLPSSRYLQGIFLSMTLSIILVFIFVLYYSRNLLGEVFENSDHNIDRLRVLKFIGYLTIGSFAGIFFAYMDTIMLGIFVSSEYIGYYRAAFSLVFGVAGLMSFVNVFLPLLTNTKQKNLQLTVNLLVKYSFILTLPSTIGIIFLARYLLVAVYGYPYLSATMSLYLLAPLIILAVNLGTFSALFSATEKLKSFTKLTIFITVLNIILNYLFITFLLPKSSLLAVSGVAAATLLSWIVYTICIFIIAKKETGFTLDLKIFKAPIISSLIMGISLYFFNYFVKDMNILKGAVEIIMGILVYFVFLLLLKGIRKEDFYLIKSIIPKNLPFLNSP